MKFLISEMTVPVEVMLFFSGVSGLGKEGSCLVLVSGRSYHMWY